MRAVETEIELLKTYREQMANDIHDLKSDVKDIKEFLMGENPKVVTKKEFDAYKNANNIGRTVLGVITALITALVTFEVMRQLK